MKKKFLGFEKNQTFAAKFILRWVEGRVWTITDNTKNPKNAWQNRYRQARI